MSNCGGKLPPLWDTWHQYPFKGTKTLLGGCPVQIHPCPTVVANYPLYGTHDISIHSKGARHFTGDCPVQIHPRLTVVANYPLYGTQHQYPFKGSRTLSIFLSSCSAPNPHFDYFWAVTLSSAFTISKTSKIVFKIK